MQLTTASSHQLGSTQLRPKRHIMQCIGCNPNLFAFTLVKECDMQSFFCRAGLSKRAPLCSTVEPVLGGVNANSSTAKAHTDLMSHTHPMHSDEPRQWSAIASLERYNHVAATEPARCPYAHSELTQAVRATKHPMLCIVWP